MEFYAIPTSNVGMVAIPVDGVIYSKPGQYKGLATFIRYKVNKSADLFTIYSYVDGKWTFEGQF